MKFEVEIEATPAEARAFLGLPDLTPLHEAWVERMKAFTMEGPSADDWQKLMRTWTSSVPGMTESVEAWQKLMLTAMTPPAFAKKAEKPGEEKDD
jgi:hypothetical protein